MPKKSRPKKSEKPQKGRKGFGPSKQYVGGSSELAGKFVMDINFHFK